MRGNPRGNPILAPDEVKGALDRYFDKNVDEQLTARQIGLALKVSQQTIARIMRGETWAHLTAQYQSPEHRAR